MSELKDIVPGLELCKLIPAGEFADSVMVWLIPWKDEECNPAWKEPEVCLRSYDDVPMFMDNDGEYYPAPTLEEVLEAIGTIEPWDTATMTRMIGDKTKLVDGALKRWMKLKEIEVKL